ncbi:TPA: hypothetical protein ACRXUG_004569 [Pseudomonas aeruginosa]
MSISNNVVSRSILQAARFIDEWQEADLDHLTESQIRAAVAFAVRLHKGFQESVLQRLVNESCHDEYLEYKGWEEALLNADGRVASNPFAEFGWWHRIANVMLSTADNNVGSSGGSWGSNTHYRLMDIFKRNFQQWYEEQL